MSEDINDELELSPKVELEKLSEQIQTETLRLMKKANEFLKRNRKGEKIPKEEQELQADAWKMVRDLEKFYKTLHSMVYPKGSKQEVASSGNPNMAKVHSMDSTVGNIVRKIGEKKHAQ